MNIFQEAFDNENLRQLETELVLRAIRDKGYCLTDEQSAAIREQVRNASGDMLDIEIPGLENEDVDLTIGAEDVARLMDEYEDGLSTKMRSISEEVSSLYLADLKARAPKMLSEYKALRSKFEQHVTEKWCEALDLLEMLSVIAAEAGEAFNKEFRPSAHSNNDLVFDALTRLHARSCQIVNEILTLLRSGYADAAFVRWRTMHEITVVGLFIQQFGQDTAERYLLHNAIESYRVTQQYQRYCTQLGYEPLTDREIACTRSSYQRLVERYGKHYAESYGWAANVLGMPKPNFADIERAVNLDHWRPHYKMASHGVHANPKRLRQ